MPRPALPLRPAAAAVVGALTLLLAGCGGGGGADPGPIVIAPDDNGRGSIVEPPSQVARISADEFKSLLDVDDVGKELKTVAGDPLCGVDLRYLQYRTVDAKGNVVNATAAIMVPAGTDAGCNGARPVVLYGHGTNVARDYNIAKWVDPNQPAAGEGLIVAAMFAAQGYIVVAPNYVGYDKSTVNYHPFLNGEQQGKDMVDALVAARKTFTAIGATGSNSLLVTGYSEGGYTAMAAHREMQRSGMPLTASAPLSAPTAISLLMDYNYNGWPPLGATVFTPMLATSWQQQFGNVYGSTGDIFEAQYATGIDTLLPTTMSSSELFASGRLPQYAMFAADAQPGPINAQAAQFYGANNLVRQSFLAQYASDIAANPCAGNAMPLTSAAARASDPLDCKPLVGFRQAAVANDLRNWLPARPVLMCGGAQDPTVNFASTTATAGYFSAHGMDPSLLTVVDLEESGLNDAYAQQRADFATAKAKKAADSGSTPEMQAQGVAGAYHGTLVPPYCLVAARKFFNSVVGAGL